MLRTIGIFLVLTAATIGPAASDDLDGNYQALFNTLRLEVADGAAVISVTSGACIGYLEGAVTKVSDTRWEILGSVAEAPCTLTVDRRADGTLEMNSGPGCSYYHGASCELSGILGKAP